MSRMYRPETPPRRRTMWAALGTPRAVQIVTVCMLLYALAIGALVYGYARVSNCLATYADSSAVAISARADIAAQDRQLDLSDRAALDRVEAARATYDNAWSDVIDGLVRKISEEDGAPIVARLLEAKNALKTVQDETTRVREANARVRAENEKQRAKSPPPPPPSESC